jgi:hypothetical protein
MDGHEYNSMREDVTGFSLLQMPYGANMDHLKNILRFTRRNMNAKGMVVAALLVALSLFSNGCGSNNSSNNSFSQTQALAATSDLFDAMSSATLASGSGLLRTPTVQEAEVSHIRNASLTQTPMVPSIAAARLFAASRAESPNTAIPAYTFHCPSGGTIVVTGSYTGTATSASVDIVETINSCSDTGFTINGNPNVTINDTLTTSGNVVTDVMTMGGGFTDGSQSCSINVNVSATVNDQTDAVSGTMSGSICGISVNSTL